MSEGRFFRKCAAEMAQLLARRHRLLAPTTLGFDVDNPARPRAVSHSRLSQIPMPFAVCVNKGPSSRSDSGPTNARRSHRPRHPSGCSQHASVVPRRLLETPSLARVGVHDRRRKLQVAKCIRWRTHEQAAHRPANRSLLRTRREASQNKALLRRGSPRFPSHQNAVNPWHKRFTRHASGPILEDRAARNAPRSSGREGDTQALTRGGRDEDNAAL